MTQRTLPPPHVPPRVVCAARFLQMGVASVVMKDVASGVLKDEAAAALEAAGDAGPVEKLQALLTKVKSTPTRSYRGLFGRQIGHFMYRRPSNVST